MLQQTSVRPELIGENPQKGKDFSISSFGNIREGSSALEIVVLLLSSQVEPLTLGMAVQLSPVLRRRRQIVPVLSTRSLEQAG